MNVFCMDELLHACGTRKLIWHDNECKNSVMYLGHHFTTYYDIQTSMFSRQCVVTEKAHVYINFATIAID